MSQCQEVIVISSDEETPSPERAQNRRLSQQFTVAHAKWMHCSDYEARGHEVLLVAEEIPRPPDRSTWMEDAVRKIYRWISDSEVAEEDLVGLSLTAWRNEGQPPVVVIGMRRKARLKKFDLLKAFEGIERDRPEFLNRGPLVVKVKHVKQSNHQGAADVAHFHQLCLSKKSIISTGASESPVENLARALVLSEAYLREEESTERRKEFDRLMNQKETYLMKRASELLQKVTKATGKEIDSAMRDFDNYYSEKFTITVFLGLDGRHVLYESWAPPVDGRPHMDIVTDRSEFHVVKHDKLAFSCRLNWKYCRLCRVDYRFEAQHECLECCRHCRKVGVCIPRYGRSCKACRRDFLSDSCFKRHLEKERSLKSTCETLKKCRICLALYCTEGGHRRHTCRRRVCQNCRAMRPASRTCHASRQSSRVGTPLESRNNGRSLREAADNSDSAKRRRLNGHVADDRATQSTRTKVLPPVTASTSREPVHMCNSPEVGRETAYSASGPTTRSPIASTAAHSRYGAGRLLNVGHPKQTRLPIAVPETSAINTFGPNRTSPAASTAAHQPDISSLPGMGTVSRRNTSADPPHWQVLPAADNWPPERVQERVVRQGAETVGVEPDLPSESGAVAPTAIQGLYYPQNGKLEIFLPRNNQ